MKTQLTQDGLEKIQNELKELKETKRPRAVDRLSKARAMGDLSENSEYSAAKEELAFVEGRIREVETILKNAEVVSNGTTGALVTLGSKITIETNGHQDSFSIVGEFEADPVSKKLSVTSPIGKALIGKKIGETVEIEVPAGKTAYKILSIN